MLPVGHVLGQPAINVQVAITIFTFSSTPVFQIVRIDIITIMLIGLVLLVPIYAIHAITLMSMVVLYVNKFYLILQ
jgi:hypothetical protein